MKAKLSKAATSIVLLGNFAPLTFMPAWFAEKNLVQKSEADEAKLELAHPEIVIFTLDWLRVVAETQKFTAISDQEPVIRVHDLVISTFSILSETPVSAIGINRHLHYQCEDPDAWHRVGDRLAPKEPWGQFALDQNGRRAGLRSLMMELNHTHGQPKGVIRVRVEPSSTIPNGVYIEVNDHYPLTIDDKLVNGDAVVETVRSQWRDAIRLAAEVAEQLLEGGQA